LGLIKPAKEKNNILKNNWSLHLKIIGIASLNKLFTINFLFSTRFSKELSAKNYHQGYNNVIKKDWRKI
jgi:hypothetical protein